MVFINKVLNDIYHLVSQLLNLEYPECVRSIWDATGNYNATLT